ncbi:ring-1,2-phenylacetyl-CoA epoxidase subunit PaaE [Saccharothrix coeruleofusca]|uniref:1,2-phenylacetyl-CoA epoxidase subunit PaaE n=1 Tax=Saccharothrix coeruleofusca TaxID=33919 RepID=UPI001AE6017B|nr:1,2-phenylacetyl-CoA epoxidase subunit PaaE [Saccharothrix coeruleofusca]MBP2339481.1 ring-1,2-phenylacetyl-CoA epoxidase subunit PaaE [Saccharothrix coeruleofusca]
MARNEFHKLTVARVDRLCDDAAAITFDVPPELAGQFAFRAGQHVTLRSGDERRSYSICAPVGAPLRIGVRRVEGGLFSVHLVDRVQPGDVLEVQPPQGRFTPSSGDHHGLVVAGSGITPALSIAGTALAQGARVTLLYGNRRTDTVMFAEELADLKDRYPARFQLVHVLSREPRDVELFSGRLDAAKLSALLDTVVPAADVDHWWLCGPYGLVRDAQSVLAARGVDPSRVHHELFYVDEPPPPPRRPERVLEAASQGTVVLDGRSTPVPLPADVPILDAAQRVRSDLPFACKGGVCGTCRALVTEGAVDMRRNYALEPGEVAAGFVLTCQSVPATPRVTVDFDA